MSKVSLLQLSLMSMCSILSACSAPQIGHPEHSYNTGNGHWLEQAPGSLNSEWSYYNEQQPDLRFHRHTETAHGSHDHTGHEHGKSSQHFNALRLSEGDRIRLWMPSGNWPNHFFGNSDSVFEGVYEIGLEGQLKLPFIDAISAQNKTPLELEKLINEQLTRKGIFKQGMAQVSITVQDLAPINVFVSGAVFNAGQKTINTREPLQGADNFNTKGQSMALKRRLSTALSASGGIRPDADVSRIQIIREHETIEVDLKGMILGYPSQDVTLQQGDQIRVPSHGLPQVELVTLSPITPPGIRLFISNLTQPAMHNAGSAVGTHATSLPYGARLHNAVASGNCAGGSASTNSDRHVVLVTTDPVRQQPVAIERNIETLLRSPHELSQNPYLMPNDSIVCYDSEVTNIREIARTITDILLPIPLLR